MNRRNVLRWSVAAAAGLSTLMTCGGPLVAEQPAPRKAPMPDTENPDAVSAAFARKLFAKLGAQPGNVVASPTSIEACLLLALAGARGQTATEIAQALALDDEDLREVATLLERYRATPPVADKTQPENPPAPEYVIANSAWVQKGFPIHDDYRRLLEDRAGATFELVDFRGQLEAARQAINAWVDSKTRHKIPELLGPGSLDNSARLVLANAIYFRGKWAKPFEKEFTRDQAFRRPGKPEVKVPLMHQDAHFRYLETDQYQAIELPYEGYDSALIVWLPKRLDGLAGLEKSLADGSLTASLEKLNWASVDVFLPRFKVSASTSLADVLASLGMKQAFTPSANFKGITDESLWISAVVHQALVEVDEVGTEAAAATAIVAVTAAAPGPPQKKMVFRADHPFLFAIRQHETGELLFVGRFESPTP